MASYHIWHPAYVNLEPLTLEMFVTLGDSIFLSRGTDAFVKAALTTLGIVAPVVSWEFQAMRTHYFSSYRETSDDWEAAWDLVWRLRVKFPAGSTPVWIRPAEFGYYDLFEADASFRPDDRPRAWSGWSCLVLADAVETSIIESARRIVADHFKEAICTRGEAFGRFHQLRCDLGYFPRVFYEQGAARAEDLLRDISETGASTRFDGMEK